jgi:hypothetical protein
MTRVTVEYPMRELETRLNMNLQLYQAIPFIYDESYCPADLFSV